MHLDVNESWPVHRLVIGVVLGLLLGAVALVSVTTIRTIRQATHLANLR